MYIPIRNRTAPWCLHGGGGGGDELLKGKNLIGVGQCYLKYSSLRFARGQVFSSFLPYITIRFTASLEYNTRFVINRRRWVPIIIIVDSCSSTILYSFLLSLRSLVRNAKISRVFSETIFKIYCIYLLWCRYTIRYSVLTHTILYINSKILLTNQ